MQIEGLPLPETLVALIDARRWKLPADRDRLAELTGFANAHKLDFMKPKQMQKETDALIALFEQGHSEIYSLTRSEEGETSPDDPSHIDVRLVVVIANNWDEEGICLDYRPGLNRPRVMAGRWPDETSPMLWHVIAKDFDAFAEAVGL